MSAAAAIRTTLVGVDATAAAFASVDRRASKAMGRLKGVAAAALAGISIGAVVGWTKNAIDEMGNLTDAAQLASTSTDELQKLSGALDGVGVKNVNIESLASAFAKMSKNTGAVGMSGFKDTLAQIAQIGDEGERMEKLTSVFGRELGASFAPLVRNGPEAFKASLQSVMDMMPGVPQATAEAGDRASDGFKAAGNAIKTAWQNVVGELVLSLESAFGENIEVIIAKGVGQFIAFGKAVGNVLGVMTANAVTFVEALGNMDFENVSYASFELDKIKQEYEDTVAKARAGVEAKNKLASGAASATADIAEKAAKAVDSMKNAFATFADASSYSTVQAAFGSGGMNYRAPQIKYERPPEIDSSVGAAVRETGMTQERLLENMVEETKRTREILENLGVM